MDLTARVFTAHGYRSLRQITYPLTRLDVFVGANGVGKTNLYRALELLRAAADNSLGAMLARDGMASTVWAGPRRARDPAEIELSISLGDIDARDRRASLTYSVVVGFAAPFASAAFQDEPQIKHETLTQTIGERRVRLVERKGHSLMARDEAGRPQDVRIDLLASETMLGRLEDPSRYPALDLVRRTLLGWRFYHDLRTDADSPLRRPGIALATPNLTSDGANLAAVFATLAHIRQDTADLDAAVEAAFRGARLVIPAPGRTASFGMIFPEFPQRTFEASELSDGTLRFLGLAGALLAYRLPPFIALNEPESSLHPDLMEALAGLVVQASERAQIWLVTHSERLAGAIAATGAGKVRTVEKFDGATWVGGLGRVGGFREDDDE
jgi:predicted ATPase